MVLKVHGGDSRDGGAVTEVVWRRCQTDGGTTAGKFLSLAFKVFQQSFSTFISTRGSLFKTLFRTKRNESSWRLKQNRIIVEIKLNGDQTHAGKHGR